MIGLILVTHGRLGDELLAAAQHVVGQQPHLHAIPIFPEDDKDARRSEIAECARTYASESGVILLTDMHGGTPANLALSILSIGQAEAISGVNLPMLVKIAPAAFRRDTAFTDAVAVAHAWGQKYIKVASWMLGGEPRS